jgi:hypothetical protein
MFLTGNAARLYVRLLVGALGSLRFRAEDEQGALEDSRVTGMAVVQRLLSRLATAVQ